MTDESIIPGQLDVDEVLELCAGDEAPELDVDEILESDAADVALDRREDAALAAPATMGTAAKRFARNTLRKSKGTQRTYLSVYRRFAAHMANVTGLDAPPPSALTSDIVASYLEMLEQSGRSVATVRKERAAINRLTRHLQLTGEITQSVALAILDVEAVTITGQARKRPALDEATWQRVKDRAAARVLELSPAGRASVPTARRDLAIIVCLGELALRSEELRTLLLTDLTELRAGSATPWLHVLGKGNRERELPLPAEVQRVLIAWLDARPPEANWNPLLFPRLGRLRHDGAFPDALQSTDANGRPRPAVALSSTALVDIVAPIMRDVGVPDEHCHPHVLRHTFATLYLQRREHDSGALSKLQDLLGHASIETTRGYLHHTRDELARSMRHPDRSVLDTAAAARRRRNTRRAA